MNTAKGGKLSKEILSTCWRNNEDGAGMAYARKGELTIVKELHSFDAFYARYEAVRDAMPKANILLHFRIRTHGLVNEENCHPFWVNNGLVFAHNGIIPNVGHSAKESDTIAFNREILQKLPEDFVYNDAIRGLLLERIGYSKLVFLTASNEYYIVGEKRGEWSERNWFSNSGYKPWATRATCTPSQGRAYQQQNLGFNARSGKTEQAGAKGAENWGNWVKKGGKWTLSEEAVKAEAANAKSKRAARKKANKADEVDYDHDDADVKTCEECNLELVFASEKYYGYCSNCLERYGIMENKNNIV